MDPTNASAPAATGAAQDTSALGHQISTPDNLSTAGAGGSFPQIDAALACAARGWPVLPVEAADKRPIGSLVRHGVDDATIDEATIRAWWAVRPDARPAISLEPSGLVALDVDVKDPGCQASVAELVPQLTDTVQQATPSGGAHALYLRTDPGQVRRIIRWKPGIDLLGKGYVVVYSESVLDGDPAPLPSVLASAYGARPARKRTEMAETDFEPASWDLLQYAHHLAIAHGPKAKFNGGNDHAYQLGALLRNDLALTEEEARPIVLAWRDAFPETREWREDYLLETVEHGGRYATGVRGTSRLDLAVLQGCADHVGLPVSALWGRPDSTEPPTAPATEPTPTAPGSTWSGREELVQLIVARKDEPWISIGVGEVEIDDLQAGSTVTLQAPTGAGKTSFVGEVIHRHCARGGYALVLSKELGRDKFAARMIGQKLALYWKAVLKMLDGATAEQMIAALPERMRVVDRGAATLGALDAELARLRAEVGPDVPILAVADYGQLLADSLPGESKRDKVGAVWDALTDLGERYRALPFVLSQMSRSNSRAARAGERLGADVVDGGAETARIEQTSSLVLELGAAGAEDGEGWSEVALSIGKGRMSGGDRVIPMRYLGRTGKWEVAGESRSAAEVRQELQERATADKAQADDQMVYDAVAAAYDARKRLSKEGWVQELDGTLSKARVKGALKRLTDAGRLTTARDYDLRCRRDVDVYQPAHAMPAAPTN